jgi:hypothetical protein
LAKTIYEIVYNLEFYEDFSYLPSAFVTSRNEEGMLTYIQHRVTADTMDNYETDFHPAHRQIVQIIDDLQLPMLEKRFNVKGKKPKTLVKIIESDNVKQAILQYIHQKLDILLTEIVRNYFYICLDAQRKDWIRDVHLKIGNRPLVPDLHFIRKDNGIFYQLRLNNGEFTWRLSNRDVAVITNHPAWIIVNGTLYKVADINGNMVKPFTLKDSIFIKKSFIKEYFQKFIVKIIPKANVTADGFKIIEYSKLNTCELSLTKNFMTNEHGLLVKFHYGKAFFDLAEKLKHKTNLEFNSVHDIIIHQCKRNFLVEKEKMDLLATKGLEDTKSNYLKLKNNTNESPYALVEWLTVHAEALKESGFTIDSPRIEEKKVLLRAPSIQLNLKQINDWFDIYGVVEVGGFTIPFYSLAQYIRTYQRLYPLPNGEYFIIPEEWMERYQALFQLAKISKNSVRLGKSQFPLLNNIQFDNVDEEVQEGLTQDFKNIDYSPPSSLKATLRPYQMEGVKWLIHLYHNQLGACLADDMGLGKTLQTIAMFLYAKEKKALAQDAKKTAPHVQQIDMFDAYQEALSDFAPLNALIILPASLVFNWEEEIKKFAPHLSVYKHVGTRRHKKVELLQGFDVMLTTYHTALKDIDALKEITFDYVVLDESQQIKNKDSKIFKAINQIQALHKISLSGTPIENSLSDLWAQMQFINPNLLGNYTFFQRTFIAPIEKKQDEIQKERLKALIAPYMLRRTKESVAKDLPELTYRIFYSEMSPQQKKLYEREKSAARNYLLDNLSHTKSIAFSSIVLNTLTKLRQIANHPLLVDEDYKHSSGKFQDITEALAVIKKGGHKTLIFSQFVSHLSLFKEHFEQEEWKYAWLTGSNTSNERQIAIKNFQEDSSISAFLISLKAGGTGLNLTAADYVFITDPWWNPSAERQAIARAHRIGQTKNVIAIKFITKDSIEEKILKLQERKTQLAEDIIENNEKIQFSSTDLAFLLE